ncbi:MAG TPA: hypothetical protein VE955_03530 [Candidatus Dormibacteraeota bacterium]|nr:hypothetical protein [Candidatus Dormibacteraeota bacterium]
MRVSLLFKVILCTVPSILFGGLAYWFYLKPTLQLQTDRKTILDNALRFLESNLWDSANGSYREVPLFTNSALAANHNLDDNFLAYVFHTEYEIDLAKAVAVHGLLARNNFTTYSRWLVLSNCRANYSRYQPYGDTAYADHVALDGIYYLKTGNTTGAREKLDFLIVHMLDARLGLLRDNATSTERFVYYKVALSLILATELGNSTYTDEFSKTLSSQQNPDGSWLTGPAQPSGVYPNTETTVLIIMALKLTWNI